MSNGIKIDMGFSDKDRVMKCLREIEDYLKYFKSDQNSQLIRPLLKILKSHEERLGALRGMHDEVPTKKEAAEIARKVAQSVITEAPQEASIIGDDHMREIAQTVIDDALAAVAEVEANDEAVQDEDPNNPANSTT